MRRICRVFLVFAALAGCGDDRHEIASNHGFGWHYDAIGDSGIMVRWDQTEIPLRLEEIEGFYLKTAECLGVDVMNIPGPLVVITGQIGDGSMGRTYLDTGLILIWSLSERYPAIYRHEFVHYFLWRMGYPDDLNRAHASPLFDVCGKL